MTPVVQNENTNASPDKHHRTETISDDDISTDSDPDSSITSMSSSRSDDEVEFNMKAGKKSKSADSVSGQSQQNISVHDWESFVERNEKNARKTSPHKGEKKEKET